MRTTLKTEQATLCALPDRQRQQAIFVLFWALFLMIFPANLAPTLAADVYIVDTAKQEGSLNLAKAVNRACDLCRPVKYMDMQGSYRIGRQIVMDLEDMRKAKTLDIVLTLGIPATRLVAPLIKDVPVFYSLTNRSVDTIQKDDNVFDMATSPSVSLQLATLKAMAPHIKQIGFLATRESLDKVREATAAAAIDLHLGIKFYYVTHSYDVPTGLRTAIQEMDALLFVQDKIVINPDTINYILQLTLENQIPTMGYTGSLVDKGLLSALRPDPDRLGQKIGEALQVYLENGTLPAPLDDPSLFQLYVNGAAMKQTPTAQAKGPAGMTVVMR